MLKIYDFNYSNAENPKVDLNNYCKLCEFS